MRCRRLGMRAAASKRRGVQIIFIDGEEAFEVWTETDSLYGARALAETWEATAHEPSSVFSGPLQAISLFVLLDLLGSPSKGALVLSQDALGL